MANKYIMHENIPVIKMSEENGICSFTILNEQLAPFIF